MDCKHDIRMTIKPSEPQTNGLDKNEDEGYSIIIGVTTVVYNFESYCKHDTPWYSHDY